MNNYKKLFELQQAHENGIRNIINASAGAILNSYFQSAKDHIEQQAVIQVAQDLNMFDISDALIEQYEVINQ